MQWVEPASSISVSRSGEIPEPTVESGWEKVVDVACDAGWLVDRTSGTAPKA
jgi:hypothetical protein